MKLFIFLILSVSLLYITEPILSISRNCYFEIATIYKIIYNTKATLPFLDSMPTHKTSSALKMTIHKSIVINGKIKQELKATQLNTYRNLKTNRKNNKRPETATTTTTHRLSVKFIWELVS